MGLVAKAAEMKLLVWFGFLSAALAEVLELPSLNFGSCHQEMLIFYPQQEF